MKRPEAERQLYVLRALAQELTSVSEELASAAAALTDETLRELGRKIVGRSTEGQSAYEGFATWLRLFRYLTTRARGLKLAAESNNWRMRIPLSHLVRTIWSTR